MVPELPLPPLFPPPLFPPHPVTPMDAIERSSTTSITQLRRRFGNAKHRTRANVAPPAEGQNRIFILFAALDGAVVPTVSVEVWAPVPLIVTKVGFTLQVGSTLTLGLILQLRSTVPANPFVPTTLIVAVPELPRVRVIVVVPPEPAVKLG